MTTARGARQRRFSRRRLLSGASLASVGIGALTVFACGREERPTSISAPAGPPRRGGVFRYWMLDPGHLDIMTTTVIHTWKMAGVVYNKLVRLTPLDRNVEPDLAQWEQADELTLIFRIPQGVKFHDKPPVNGRELTARDVVFSLDRIRSPEPVFIHRADYRAIERVEAVDTHTVRIATSAPDASVLNTLGNPQTIITAPEVIEQFRDLKSTEAQIGTGPFVLQSFDRSTGGRLVRHPQYFKAGLPYLDGLELFLLGSSDQAWDLFLAGRLDTANVAREEVSGFDAKARGLISAPDSACGGAPLTWTFNLQRKPFDDIRIRRALSLILDRQEAKENGYPGFPPPLSRISVALGLDHEFYNLSIEETERLPWGWDPKKRSDDLRQGIQLLEQAGITQANPLRIEIIGDASPSAVHGVITGEYMKGYLEKVTQGRVLLTLRYLQVAAWRERAARGDFDAEFSHNCLGFDVDHALSKMYGADGGRNYGRWNDPEMERLLAKQRAALDRRQRKAAVNEAQRYIADQVPHASIAYGAVPVVVKQSVQGYVPGQGFEQLERTWFAT